MVSVALSYGRSRLMLDLPSDNHVQILEPNPFLTDDTPEAIVTDALAHPINSPGLCELTRQASKILIITNDNTRPMPSMITIPAIIKSFYHPPEHYDITVLIATGLHRPMTEAEMLEQYGQEVCTRYKVVNHDARDTKNLISHGRLPSGNELLLNRLVSESDLIISEGFIESHFFAGFSGGRKSILPGVAGESTILNNHKPENIADKNVCAASLIGNPIHEECSIAAKRAGLRFILNVALDKEKRIIAAFAGDPFEAHIKGCRFVEDTMSVSATPTDIVVTSNNGYPLDRNLYQVVKGIDMAAHIAKEGGVIIVAARCEDAVGHTDFRDLILSCDTLETLYQRMSVSPSAVDKWQVQVLAKVLIEHTVILVSEGIERELAEKMFFTYAQTMDEAMRIAFAKVGAAATVTVIPEGPVIIPRVKA